MSIDNLIESFEEWGFVMYPCSTRGCKNWYIDRYDSHRYVNGMMCKCGRSYCQSCIYNITDNQCNLCNNPKPLRLSRRESSIEMKSPRHSVSLMRTPRRSTDPGSKPSTPRNK